MKKIILVLIFITTVSYKVDNLNVTKINIYLVNCCSTYKVEITPSYLDKKYRYFFSMKGFDFQNMFDSYDDCFSKLKSAKLVSANNSARIKVVLFFRKKQIVLYFNNEGNYFFNNEWHEFIPNLYYLLFKNISSEVIPEETINKAKLRMDNDFWNG